jgi:hypothetical protein
MIRAYVTEQIYGYSLAISIVRNPDGDTGGMPPEILRLASREDPATFLDWEPLDPRGQNVKPTLTLSHEEARALLDTLTTHYGGVDDKRTLRKDYDDERKRVDKLTEALTGIAHTLSSPTR